MDQSRRNVMAIVSLVLALVGMFAVDDYLHRQGGFTEQFGSRSFDGQILRKRARGERMAEVADVLVFGGSYTRYGVTKTGFEDRNLVVYNHAYSGGGPMSSFYTLEHLVPILDERTEKPVLVLEIVREPLIRTESAWSEFVHVNGLLRGRDQQISEFDRLWEHFAGREQADRFFSNVVMPSYTYRRQSREVLRWGGLYGSFWGFEDEVGGSLLYWDVAPEKLLPEPHGVVTEELARAEAKGLRGFALSETKLDYVRRFIRLAHAHEVPVCLLSSARIQKLDEPRDYYEPIYDRLREELGEEIFSGVQIIRQQDYELSPDDFSSDSFKHPNVRGAGNWSREIARILSERYPELRNSRTGWERKMARITEEVSLPALEGWNGFGTSIRLDDAGELILDGPPGMIAESPEVDVVPNAEYLAEIELSLEAGRISFSLGGPTADGYRASAQATDVGIPNGRVPVRHRSSEVGRLNVRLHAYGDVRGRIESIRLLRPLIGRSGGPEILREPEDFGTIEPASMRER